MQTLDLDLRPMRDFLLQTDAAMPDQRNIEQILLLHDGFAGKRVGLGQQKPPAACRIKGSGFPPIETSRLIYGASALSAIFRFPHRNSGFPQTMITHSAWVFAIEPSRRYTECRSKCRRKLEKHCGGCGGEQPADRQSVHRNLARQQCSHRTSLEKSKKRACNMQTVVLLYLLSVDAAASLARSEYGALAQLVARNVRNVEVRGSNPLCSTKNLRNLRFFLFASLCLHSEKQGCEQNVSPCKRSQIFGQSFGLRLDLYGKSFFVRFLFSQNSHFHSVCNLRLSKILRYFYILQTNNIIDSGTHASQYECLFYFPKRR